MKHNVNKLSIINPSLDKMLEQVDNRYALVVLASKRAKELAEGKKCLLEKPSSNVINNAFEEVVEKKITYSMEE